VIIIIIVIIISYARKNYYSLNMPHFLHDNEILAD